MDKQIFQIQTLRVKFIDKSRGKNAFRVLISFSNIKECILQMEMMGWSPVHVQIVLNHLQWMPCQDRWFFRTILLLIPTWPKLVLIIQLIWLVWWKLAMKQQVTAGQISLLLIFTRYERVLLHYFKINL